LSKFYSEETKLLILGIVTRLPTEKKYEKLFDLINEIEFLVDLVRKGVKIYFLEHHKKYLLANFSIVTGSANYRPSGRYLSYVQRMPRGCFVSFRKI